MSLLENLLAPGTIERLGWMLVHILWQATVVAVLLALFLRLLRKSSANVRYGIACAALAMMVAMPIVTMRLMKTPGPAAEAGPPSAGAILPTAEVPVADSEQAGGVEYWNDGMMGERLADAPTVQCSRSPIFHSSSVPLQERIVSTLEPALPYVVLGWLVGVFGLSAWHLGGWAQLQRLRRRMVREIGRPLQQRLGELSVRLGVRRAVGLLESALIEVPTVVGWLRPVILLPASALTGLRPEQLEAILAHELAHVRRYDYLVNIVQTVVEILGFYHPAVWWVSRRIRIERENCCDDLAVHVCGSSLQYARALACMEEIRHSGRELAMAATGGSLVARIARLLGRPAVDDRRFAWLPGLVALLLVAALIIPAALVLGTPQRPQAVEPTAIAANHSAAEPNDAPSNTESASGSSNAQAAQIDLKFKVIRVQDDLRVNRETVMQIAKTLGIVLPTHEPDQSGQTPDLTVGEILRQYFVPQPLSAEAGEELVSLLQSKGYLKELSQPRLFLNDNGPARIQIIDRKRFPPASAQPERTEYGTVINAIPHVLDANRVTLEMKAEVSDLVPGPDSNQPTILRTSAETNVTAWNDQYLVWAAVTPTATPAGPEADQSSVYVMVKPHINMPPQGLALAPDERRPDGTPPRHVWLDVRTVTMDSGALDSLGVQWSRPTGGPSASVRTGSAMDETFTDVLLTALDRLQADHRATVSSQQIIVQERYQSQIRALRDQWSAGAQPHKTETGMVLKVRPHVANDNTIRLELAIDATRQLPTPPGSDLPMQSSQTCQSTVTIKDGGTTAIGGLSMPGAQGQPGQETVIFVTTHLLPDRKETPVGTPQASDPNTRVTPPASQTPEQTASMRREYVNSDPMVNELSKSITAMERDLIAQQAPPLQEYRPTDPPALVDLKDKLVSRRQELEKEFDDSLTARTGGSLGDRTENGKRTTITATFTNTDLRGVLSEIAQRTGAKITPDATVKTASVTTELTGASAEAALHQVLKNTPYIFRKTEDNGCLVFRPLSFTFPQVELLQVIQDLSVDTGVPIVAAPNVSGTVTATFENVSLDEALELVLAGKPYVWRKMPRYYLVTDRAAASPPPRPATRPVVRAFSPVTTAFAQTDLRDALAEISKRTGAQITPDATVKPTPITAKLADASVDTALQEVLKDTSYSFRKADDGTYLVFRPLSNFFPSIDLIQAFQDLSVATGVPVVAAPNVSGTVRVAFENLSLDEALELVLAGKPYVLRKMPRYYLVTDRAAASPPPRPATRPVVRAFSPVTATFAQTDLRDALAEISKCTGAQITPDATVKPTLVTAKLINASADVALRQVLKDTPYRFEKADDGTYLVFLPLSNVFPGVDLTLTLQDLSAAAGVPIVVAPDVSGTVTVWFENLSLEAALEIVLAGKPYVFQKMPRYYLVAPRSLPDLQQVGETRRIRLNHVRPAQVTQHLSPVFAPYVQAEQPNPGDPNGQDNVLLITAAPAIADRIEADIKQIDRVRRQVLLDAHVVVMEKGNLLNLGAEWSWPTIQSGTFANPSATNSAGTTSGWPYGIQIGSTPDRTFTDSLMMALNLLVKNKQAEIIANPKVVAQDGRQVEMNVIEEEWFMMISPGPNSFVTGAKLSKIESGTVLTITPDIGDNNDITLQMAVEISDIIPKARGGSDLPRTTRRLAKNAVTVKDGGTVAVAGWTENRSKMTEQRVPVLGSIPLIGGLFRSKTNEPSNREVAVFVTVHLVPDTSGAPLPTSPAVKIAAPAASQVAAERATASTSETRRVRLSRVSPSDAKGLLPETLAPYVQEEAREHQKTFADRGRIVIVTAPRALADRIVEELQAIDRHSRQVLLDTRVIAIEPSALQDLPLQWNGLEHQASGLSAQTLMTLGSAPDQAATAVLRKELDLLRTQGRAQAIMNPCVVVQGGHQTKMTPRAGGDWYGAWTPNGIVYAKTDARIAQATPAFRLTPHLDDNNDIRVEVAIGLYDSTATASGEDPTPRTWYTTGTPVATKDGGTVLLTGLPTRPFTDKGTCEDIVVLVTASLVPDAATTPQRTPGSGETLTQIDGDSRNVLPTSGDSGVSP